MIDPRFLAHNSHLLNPKRFGVRDPQLAYLATQKYRYLWPLIDQLPIQEPGVYTLSGGRQIGKTTLLKQWMAKLLKEGVNPEAVAFFTGELIDDHYTLIHLLQSQLEKMPERGINYLIIDEVTYITDWDKAIKFAADAGMFRSTIVIITGSDTSFLKEARMRFPGRRGKAAVADFHLYSLSFYEFVALKGGISSLQSKLQHLKFSDADMNKLYELLGEYLQHGGFLTGINDLAMEGRILNTTLITYSDWIRGDVLKRGKQERYLKEILGAIVKKYTSQLTWNTLAADLSINHPKTVIDYVSLLESMDTLFIQSALLENKLVAAPKKARKVTFTDPFIFHAVRAWLEPVQNPYEDQILDIVNNPKQCSMTVEACVSNHYRRHFPTYYIKGDGEVDVAYVKEKRFWPVEVKWTERPPLAELKQILKYPNGLVLTKQDGPAVISHLQALPIPVALLALG